MANTNTVTTNYSLPVPELTNTLVYDIPRIKTALQAVDTALFGKQATLVSGTNIKTVNGVNLLGSGDIIVAGSGGGLAATTIKTAAYTSVANDLVRCNTAAGAFNVTFPASPSDGATIGFVDTNNSFGTNNLTILPNTGQTIESDNTSFILDISGAAVSFVYTGTNWKLLQTPSVPATAILTTGKAIAMSIVFGG
jgi:hypothetical protein